MGFRVQITDYHGPLDLLLYLVRKQELGITEIPLASVTDQFLEFVTTLESLNIELIGEFLDVATALIELKSQQVLPHEEDIEESKVDDAPSSDLVKRLLEFKQFRVAASVLEERGRAWRDSFARRPGTADPVSHSIADQPIRGMELWDLVSVFGRILKERQTDVRRDTEIVLDELPLAVYMQRLYLNLVDEKRIEFECLFPDLVHKTVLIGYFLAILELVRFGHASLSQSEAFGTLWMALGEVPYEAAPTLETAAK